MSINAERFRDELAKVPNAEVPLMVATMTARISEGLETEVKEGISVELLTASVQFLAELVSVLATRVATS